MNRDWMRRRFMELRFGHSFYMVMALSFTNFTIIAYSLFIVNVPALKAIFPNIYVFAVAFLSVYIPFAIMFGVFHRRYQMGTEQRILTQSNKDFIEIFRQLKEIRERLGIATDKEQS